jgi:3'-phosphoadenosine 5'-phosphosulfate sulfotransferase (PAPS reductase)/FAD synthetase/predicted RNA-binding protein with PUA domain
MDVKDPAFKKVLYWCRECNIPLIARRCACGAEGSSIPLLMPYDVRPALDYDQTLIHTLLFNRFGVDRVQKIVLFNKTGGIDRNDLIIMNGKRFGWLSFDPYSREFTLDLSQDSLSYILPHATKGIVDISEYILGQPKKHLGGKRIPVDTDVPDGYVIVRAGTRYGTGILKEGKIKIRQLAPVEIENYPDPDWNEAVAKNAKHLKNLERHAVRQIKAHTHGQKRVNVAFSGGKDSTVVLELARRAGITEAYYVDTGMEFPETESIVKSMNIRTILHGDDFWKALEERGPPCKDDRWCCDRLKLEPVKRWLAGEEVATIQGNRWYESFARSGLPISTRNPFNPQQTLISPIRHWRALEVFLYIWWRNLPCNRLYDDGFERVGCWVCPAMLESEYERIKETHPELFGRWHRYLVKWATRNRYPREVIECGLWRWRELPPKMKELVKVKNIRYTPNNPAKKGK